MKYKERGTWIADGEKCALIGLHIKTTDEVQSKGVAPGLSVLSDTKFRVPDLWREWLGSVQTEQVEDCNLFLMSKMASATPDILDGENQVQKLDSAERTSFSM